MRYATTIVWKFHRNLPASNDGIDQDPIDSITSHRVECPPMWRTGGWRCALRAPPLVLWILVLPTSEARAGGHDGNKSTEALYAEARAALDAGDYEKACPLFEEYYERDPVQGALFALAECEARWGKPARSISHFEEFLRRSADSPATSVQEQRTRIANDQIARLSQQVGKVTPIVSPSVQGSVLVKLDGAPVAMPARPIAVEPGEHTLELLTEAGTREQRRFIVGAGEARQVEIGGPVQPPSRPAATEAPTGRDERPRISLPVAVAGGVGTAGLLLGGTCGVLAWAAVSDIHAHCDGRFCDADGKHAADRAKSLATVSTVGIAVGLVGFATATVLYLLDHRRARSGAARVPVVDGGIGASF